MQALKTVTKNVTCSIMVDPPTKYSIKLKTIFRKTRNNTRNRTDIIMPYPYVKDRARHNTKRLGRGKADYF